MGKKTIILYAVIFMISGSCFLEASGFRNFELGARAATLGGAFVARVDDVSAVYYNPAGLAFLSGIRLKTNINYLKPTSKAEYPGSPVPFKSTPSQLRASHFVSLNIKDRIGIGIGGFTLNSLETQWPEDWPGHALSVFSKLNAFYVRPAVAVKISNNLAVGAGIDFIFSDVTWIYDRIFHFYSFEIDTVGKSEVSRKGLGFVAGILIRMSDNLRIGGRYQPKVKLQLEGSNSFNFRYYWQPNLFNKQKVTSAITMPQEFVLGLMFLPAKKLTLQLDLQRIGMSEIKKWEFNLDPHFYEELEDFYGYQPDFAKPAVDLNLKNTWRIMFGAEYHLNDFMALRAGYTYQESAVEGRMLHPVFPDLDTNILSLGIGYEGPVFSTYGSDEQIGEISFDAYFQYGFSPSCTSTLPEFPATIRANEWIIGIGLGFNFGVLKKDSSQI